MGGLRLPKWLDFCFFEAGGWINPSPIQIGLRERFVRFFKYLINSYIITQSIIVFFPGSIKSRYGSRVGDSGPLLDMISYHNSVRIEIQILRMTEVGCLIRTHSLYEKKSYSPCAKHIFREWEKMSAEFQFFEFQFAIGMLNNRYIEFVEDRCRSAVIMAFLTPTCELWNQYVDEKLLRYSITGITLTYTGTLIL